ncbi:MAG TPA: BrnA antitoxin family protein [Candidatus Acidoferrum sp.]|nr:BrnA antitoxin family protein [Candidatus Acidoferrum sp.]
MNGGAKTPDPELQALLRLRDEDIDTSDIPEITDWSKAVVGKFYRPIKSPVTIRLDADVLAWLKRSGPGYQTRINALLRQAMHGGPRPASRRAANPRIKKSR